MDEKIKTNVIAFPNQKTNAAFEAQEEELNRCFNTITAAMELPCWDKLPNLLPQDLETLSEFGETIQFAPQVSARLISTMAKIIRNQQIMEDLHYD